MRKINRQAFIVIAAFSFATSAAHAETLRLICGYSHTVDENGKSSPMSGDDLFTVDFDDTGKAQIRNEGLGAILTGSISDDEILGDTSYEIQGSTYTQHLVINRYTGSLTTTFSINGKGGLTHFGKCRASRGKRF